MARRSRAAYRRFARYYDLIYHGLVHYEGDVDFLEKVFRRFHLEPKTILDLGCGYGVIGIVAAHLSQGGHVILTDVNERAAALARANLVANGTRNAEVRIGDVYAPIDDLVFDHILCNPPIRAGRVVVDRIISEAPSHLLDGGSLWLVARTRQGADTLRLRMRNAFDGGDVVKRGSGYKVLRSVKSGA